MAPEAEATGVPREYEDGRRSQIFLEHYCFRNRLNIRACNPRSQYYLTL